MGGVMRRRWGWTGLAAIILAPAAGATPLASDWTGLQPAASSLALAGTDTTNTLLEDTPPWARNLVVDTAPITGNPALLARLDTRRKRRFPLVMQTAATGGQFGIGDAVRARDENAADLSKRLQTHRSDLQESRLLTSSAWVQKGLGFRLGFDQTRLAFLSDDGRLSFERHKDLTGVVSAGGAISESETGGNLDIGVSIKSVFRSGDDFELAPSEQVATRSLRDEALKKRAVAFGIDYSFLYTLPKKWLSDWVLQTSFVWKDIGTSPFTIGNRTSAGRKFRPYPNNQIFGVGLGLPKFTGGIRSTVRLECREWSRSIAARDKLAASYELRLPFWASFRAGVSGSRVSGGAGLRFPSVELDLATYSKLWLDRHNSRQWVLELRGVF